MSNEALTYLQSTKTKSSIGTTRLHLRRSMSVEAIGATSLLVSCGIVDGMICFPAAVLNRSQETSMICKQRPIRDLFDTLATATMGLSCIAFLAGFTNPNYVNYSARGRN